jgi:hypothetical protein
MRPEQPARPEPHEIPRCANLDGTSLYIVPAYTEAGMYCEANCITVTDGERTVVYVPVAVAHASLGEVGDLGYHVVDAALSAPAAD